MRGCEPPPPAAWAQAFKRPGCLATGRCVPGVDRALIVMAVAMKAARRSRPRHRTPARRAGEHQTLCDGTGDGRQWEEKFVHRRFLTFVAVAGSRSGRIPGAPSLPHLGGRNRYEIIAAPGHRHVATGTRPGVPAASGVTGRAGNRPHATVQAPHPRFASHTRKVSTYPTQVCDAWSPYPEPAHRLSLYGPRVNLTRTYAALLL